MSKNEYSHELAAAVKKFLDDDKWHYSFKEDLGLFEFTLRTRSKIQKIDYVIDIHEDEIVVYGICPVGADHDDYEMMAQMAEFLCRANYGIKNGNFEFDFRDGEIRYKSYIDCEGVSPSSDMIKNSVGYTSSMYRRYAPGITDIIFTGCSAKKAIAKCDKTSEEEIRSMVSEVLGETDADTDVETLLSRLAAHLGIAEESDELIESSISSAGGTEGVA